MLPPAALALVLALLQPAPTPQPIPTPPAPASATPVVSPTPLPTPIATTTPIPPTPAPTATPVPTPTPQPTATPPHFGYVVDPSPGPSGSPQIVEVSINDHTLHAGGMLLVKVTTSADVTSLFARTMGHQIGIPLIAPGIFAGQTQLPDQIPFFLLNRTYPVDFVATTADGRTTTASLPIRLER